MKLQTHEEIQQFLLQPARRPLLRKIIQRQSKYLLEHEKKRFRHGVSLNRLLLKSVFGERAFSGPQGRTLKAFAEFRPKYNLRSDKLREFGKTLREGGQLLRFAVQLDPDQLHGFNENEADVLIHELSKVAEYIFAKGEDLHRRAKW